LKKFIETGNLLKCIKAEDLDTVYDHITDKAAEWAVAGYLEHANNLLQDLWNLHAGDSGNVRRQLEGLRIMWELSNKFPSTIPFELRDIDEIEQENFKEVFFNNQYENRSLPDLLNQLEKDIQSTSGFDYCVLASRATLLSLENDLVEVGKKFIHIWGVGYMLDYNYMVGYLTRNRKSSALLLEGILDPTFELTNEKCQFEYGELSAALKKRKEKGRTLIYGDLSWQKLLENISVLAIKDDPALYAGPMTTSNWLGNDPALEDDILTTERRIGMKLPEDYREFLKVSNGFTSHSNIYSALLPVEKIDWLSVLEKDLVDIVEESIEMEKEKYHGLTKKCLLVGGLFEEEQVLLFPTSDSSWECWSLVVPGGCGETWYPGFRYYIESRLYFLECL